jgi:prepilin-type N-terminal cleavage/methylation domain-containing protein
MVRTRSKGFTLIELLIVVGIIGLLSTLAAVALSGARARSRDSKRIADITQVQKALELSYVQANGHPVTAAAGVTLGTGTRVVLCNVSGVAGFVATQAGCTGGGTVFMGLVPASPSPGVYTYKSTNANGTATCTSGNCAGFCVQATLERDVPQSGLVAGNVVVNPNATVRNGSCP